MSTAQIQIPPKLIPVFTGPARYRGSYGGRGSGKTRTFALMTAVRAYMAAEAGQSGVILCAREFMNSLEESSLEEVKQAIRSVDWLNDYFDMGERYIKTKCGSIRYVFTGLRHNLDSIKSKARILICWIDEAEPVSEVAFRKLLPTVREDNSEVWLTWNPEKTDSAVNTRFIVNAPDDAKIVEMNYSDNPWFPDVLEQERLRDQATLDPNTYSWIWEGDYLEMSDSQILAGKVRVSEFEPGDDWDGPYHGLDYGFAQDPTAAVKAWVYDGCLFVEYEAGRVGLEISETAEYLKERISGIEKHVIRADSARPETTSHLKNKDGFNRIQSVAKWSGSVEDGIAHLRGYKEIVIHPRCKETIKETRLYSYKVDKNTGDVLPTIIDKHNHYIDALRYALGGLIKAPNQAAVFAPKRLR